MKKFLSLLIAAAFLLLVTGCRGEISLEYTGTAGRESYNDQLTVQNGITAGTTNLLGNYLLTGMLRKDPDKFIPVLESLLKSDRTQEVRIALAESALLLGKKFRNDPDKSVRFDLTALIHAQNYLKEVIANPGSELFDPDIPVAIRAYNTALTELFDYLQSRKLHRSSAFALTAAGGQIINFDPPRFMLPVKPEHITAFHLCADYRTGNLTHSNRRFGIGIQLICELAKNSVPETVFAEEQVIPGTMVMQIIADDNSKRGNARLYYLDSRSIDQVPVKDFTLPLAQDFSTPLAYMIRKPPAMNFLKRTFMLDTDAAYEGLYHLEPHQDNRIPVILVHGLMSDIRTWMQMLNTLLSDPILRKHYRFMGYTYSSGNPILYSASHLRQALERERKKLQRDGRDLRNFDRMVVIGHSMGGLLTRLLVSTSDEKLLQNYFGKEIFAQMQKSQPEMLKQLLIFSPYPSVKRVVFIAVPHKGADLADSWVGKIGASMVRLPQTLIDVNTEIIRMMINAGNREYVENMEIFTGIDNLSPDNPTLKLLAKMPMSPLPKHSIIGNQKGQDIPGGSDGVVPYYSSHLNNVLSEKVVQSGHSVQQNPLAIQEIRRILREHLQTFPDIKMENH